MASASDESVVVGSAKLEEDEETPTDPSSPSLEDSILERNDDEELSDNPVDMEQCASALAEFLRIDTSTQMSELEEQVEELLRHSQEVCGHLAKIQTDTSFALQHKIPEIHSRAMQMKGMYEQIDNLEAFVALISKNVAEMEDSVGNAEKLFGSNAISRVLKGFSKPSFFSGFGSKSKPAAVKPDNSRFEAPAIFCTDDFLPTSPSESRSELPAEPAAATTPDVAVVADASEHA
ncbi:biogenesis of lysosome-related organelles complex 1 subunit 4-like [Sycon ciliatum]|uniref:biogenesis of lysosome-related organelles complex 1 subunit 4-like n=1 Tax=Sycon ciliatum TaxID=27933 RepID=UPI0031F70ED6